MDFNSKNTIYSNIIDKKPHSIEFVYDGEVICVAFEGLCYVHFYDVATGIFIKAISNYKPINYITTNQNSYLFCLVNIEGYFF